MHGETHHVQRNVALKHAVIIGYGNISDEEKNIFKQLIKRNAKNMCFESYQIIFEKENELEQTVRDVISSWEK